MILVAAIGCISLNTIQFHSSCAKTVSKTNVLEIFQFFFFKQRPEDSDSVFYVSDLFSRSGRANFADYLSRGPELSSQYHAGLLTTTCNSSFLGYNFLFGSPKVHMPTYATHKHTHTINLRWLFLIQMNRRDVVKLWPETIAFTVIMMRIPEIWTSLHAEWQTSSVSI